MDPAEIHDALLDTFSKWVSFALGVSKVGGQVLRHPSGRLASAIKAETNPDGHIVAVYIDPDAQEELVKLSGHKEFSLKQRMLRAGMPGVRHNKKTGNLYRYIPIANQPKSPSAAFSRASSGWMKNLFTMKETTQGGVLSINQNLAKMWAIEHTKAHTGSDKIRTMSYKRGSAAWKIPAMPAFNIQRLLRQMVPPAVKDRIF